MASAMLTPIITGKITVEIGRRAPFYLLGGVSAFFALVIFIFFEETAFVRDGVMHGQQAEGVTPHSSSQVSTEKRQADVTVDHDTPQSALEERAIVSRIGTFEPATLSIFSHRFSKEPLLKSILRPVILIAHPAVFWGCATQGLVTAWTVMLATVLAALFATYPYFYDAAKIGYLYTGPFVGAMIALPLSGLSSDYLARTLTRRRGVYEPEYRLLLIIPFTITAAIGLFGFGYTVDMHETIPAAMFGFVIASVIFSTVSVGTYVADAYQSLDVDCFIAFLLVKNMLAYALTVTGYDWLNRDGVKKMFLICGCSQMGICALSIPLYLFGKLVRQWSAGSTFWQGVFH